MKPLVTALLMATLLFTTSKAQALFGHVAAETHRREHAEQQYIQQEQINSHLHVVISVLSAGVTIALVIGAAAGSKTRNNHES